MRQRWHGDVGDPDVHRLLEPGVQQAAHMAVTLPPALAAEDHADQSATFALHRGDEVEAGGADIAGLDAVGAFVMPQKLVVVVILVAFPGEAGRREVLRSEEHTSELQSLMRISY